MGKKITIFIILISILLRFIGANQSLWLDEAAQAIMSSRSVSQIWFDRSQDFHPPLFYLLAHLWMQVSTTEIWLRILPITFGVLSVIALMSLSKLIFSPIQVIKFWKFQISPWIYTGLIFAIAPFHVYYSKEFRSYSLLTLLVIISAWSAVKYLQSKKNHYILLFSLLNAAILYTHYSGVFYLITIYVFLLFADKKSNSKILFSQVLTGLLFLPWLPQFINQLSFGLHIGNYLPGWSQMLSLSPMKALPTLFFKLVAGRINIFPQWMYGIYAFLVISFIMFTLYFVRTSGKIIYSLIFGPIITMILVSILIPQTQPFRILFILPFICLGFTVATIRFPRIVTISILYICIFGNLMQITRPRLQRENWREAVEYLQRDPARVLVKFPSAFAPLIWYGPHLDYLPLASKFPIDRETLASQEGEISKSSKLYLVDYLTEITDPNRVVESKLKELGFTEKYIQNIEGVGFIRTYVRDVY